MWSCHDRLFFILFLFLFAVSWNFRGMQELPSNCDCQVLFCHTEFNFVLFCFEILSLKKKRWPCTKFAFFKKRKWILFINKVEVFLASTNAFCFICRKIRNKLLSSFNKRTMGWNSENYPSVSGIIIGELLGFLYFLFSFSKGVTLNCSLW